MHFSCDRYLNTIKITPPPHTIPRPL
jgi:hypothetical protein